MTRITDDSHTADVIFRDDANASGSTSHKLYWAIMKTNRSKLMPRAGCPLMRKLVENSWGPFLCEVVSRKACLLTNDLPDTLGALRLLPAKMITLRKQKIRLQIPYLSFLVPVKNEFVTTISPAVHLK